MMIPSIENPLGYRFFEDDFPDSYKGCVFKTDFRAWLRYDWLMARHDLKDSEKIRYAMRLCCQSIRKGMGVDKIVEGLNWFAGCGESDRIKLLKITQRLRDDIEDEAERRRDRPKTFSYFWDYQKVWAAFRGRFQIDLHADNLHWWKFVGLMEILYSEPPISRLIELRSVSDKDKPSRQLLISSMLAAVPAEGQEGDNMK
ncbi:hypothetical protein C4J81_13725 [Deltaproteobacteria bacterium Smac51]|nr:hypothetical protein C4J81_13725 [Deltaproteobacteria bacterium Smac51]